MLGTLEFDHPLGLLGHSDGDVVAHAICDAMLAASGGPDIGGMFPPGDPAWAGASGERLLGLVRDRLTEEGHRLVNVHAIVVCERPKVGPHRAAMAARIAEILELPVSRCSVKATTTEGLGFTGRSEGLAAQAVATVMMPA